MSLACEDGTPSTVCGIETEFVDISAAFVMSLSFVMSSQGLKVPLLYGVVGSLGASLLEAV